MNGFRGVYAEQTDFFIFTVISDHDGIPVNDPDHLVLAGNGYCWNDKEKEGQKMNGFNESNQMSKYLGGISLCTKDVRTTASCITNYFHIIHNLRQSNHHNQDTVAEIRQLI